MKIERTKNATKNITVGLLQRIVQTILPFFMRTAMIRWMGVQYLGLNSLFTSILHILNLAELGVGSAMVFSMYKPIAEDDSATVCALLRLYRKYYRLIGVFIAVVGLLLTPFIPRLISGDIPSELNVYVLYLLNLSITVITYWLFAYKGSLLQAHQRADVISLVTTATYVLQTAVQFVALAVFKSYYLFVITALATQAITNVVTAAIATKMYPHYHPRGTLSPVAARDIRRRIRDLFTAKMGSVLLSSADTVVISACLGLTVLAVYQNYYFILSAVISVMEMMLGAVVAGLGNSFVTETRQKNFADLQKFTFLYLWLIGTCVCCFLGLYQPFMMIWTGPDLMLGYGAVVCFAAYFCMHTFLRLMSVYKDAAGIWRADRFRPLISSAINLLLNLISVWFLGIYGVLLSTILSILLVSLPWILHNLFTNFFELSQLKPYLLLWARFGGAILLSAVIVAVACNSIPLEGWALLACNVVLTVTIPSAVFFLLFRKTELFSQSVQFVDGMTKGKLRLTRLLPHN